MYMNFHMLIYYNTTLNPEKETPGECVWVHPQYQS